MKSPQQTFGEDFGSQTESEDLSGQAFIDRVRELKRLGATIYSSAMVTGYNALWRISYSLRKQSVLRRDRGDTTQTSTRPVSEEAGQQRNPAMGTEKRTGGLTQVSTEGDIAEPSGTGWAHSPQNNPLL